MVDNVQVVAQPARHAVGTRPAIQQIGPAVAIQLVVALHAQEHIGAVATRHPVRQRVTGPAEAPTLQVDQVFHLSTQGEARQARIHLVHALAGKLDSPIPGMVDNVQVVAQPARHAVGTRPAIQQIGPAVAIQLVVALHAQEHIGAVATRHPVRQRVTGSTEAPTLQVDQVLHIGTQGEARQGGIHLVHTGTGRLLYPILQLGHFIGVIPCAAGHHVSACPTDQQVVAAIPIEAVVARTPVQGVIADTPIHQVRPDGPGQVAAPGRRREQRPRR
ncbi:hypothetical protein D9M68_665910 [compost metagenome]